MMKQIADGGVNFPGECEVVRHQSRMFTLDGSLVRYDIRIEYRGISTVKGAYGTSIIHR